MNLSKTLLASTLVAASGLAQAELSGNIGAVSDYVFRGVSFSDDAAIQGGLDYANESGFYAGTWLSTLGTGGGEELDLYAGFGGEAGSMSYDISAVYFAYPGSGGDAAGGDLDYAELVASLGFGAITASIGYSFWEETDNDVAYGKGDLYYGLSADLPVDMDGFGLSIYAGYYDFDDDGADLDGVPGDDDASYTHWGASLSKDVGDLGAFSFNYDETDGDEEDNVVTSGDAIFSVAWTKSF